MPTVTHINIYPVKGCRASSVSTAEVSTFGLKGDRVFSVMEDGTRSGQKKIANLRQLGAVWQDATLRLSYPGMQDFMLDSATAASSGHEAFRGREVPLEDMGNDVATWLSDALQRTVRLARQHKPTPWPLPLPEFASVDGEDQDRFMDAAPILLVSSNSLSDLNQRMSEPVTMDRFRGNIEIEGLPAYEEDSLPSFHFPDVTLDRVAVCERCIITTIDQETGQVGKEPLSTLSKYRKRDNDYAGGIMFGIYLTGAAGRLTVGDSLNMT
jgi:uncharacterized protein YcbX